MALPPIKTSENLFHNRMHLGIVVAHSVVKRSHSRFYFGEGGESPPPALAIWRRTFSPNSTSSRCFFNNACASAFSVAAIVVSYRSRRPHSSGHLYLRSRHSRPLALSIAAQTAYLETSGRPSLCRTLGVKYRASPTNAAGSSSHSSRHSGVSGRLQRQADCKAGRARESQSAETHSRFAIPGTATAH